MPDTTRIVRYMEAMKSGDIQSANAIAQKMLPADVIAANEILTTPPASMGGRKIGLPNPATLGAGKPAPRVAGPVNDPMAYGPVGSPAQEMTLGPVSVPVRSKVAGPINDPSAYADLDAAKPPILSEGGGAAESAVVDRTPAIPQGRNPSSRNPAGVDQVDPGAMVGSGRTALSKPWNFLGDPSAKVSIGQALLGLAGMLGDAIGGAGKEAYLGIESPTRLQQEYKMKIASQQQANQIFASMEAEIAKIHQQRDADIAIARANNDAKAEADIKVNAQTLENELRKIAQQAYVNLQNSTLGRASLPGGGKQIADDLLKGAGQGAPTP